MPYDITNFPNSFIQVCTEEEESCNDYDGVVLPIHYVGDIAFAFLTSAVDLTDATDLTFAISRESFAAATTYNPLGSYNVVGSIGGSTAAYDALFLKVVSDDLCLELDLATLDVVDGECLYLVMYKLSTGEVVCTLPQKFNYKTDLCFTEVVKYRCADDAYGFPYSDLDTMFGASYYNVIRLNLDITSPKPLTKKKGFRKSDGAYLTLAATKEKQWDVMTDWYTDHIHQCLDVAIDHDTVYIFQDAPAACSFTASEMYHPEDDKYDIDWQEKPGQHLGIAQAKFKMNTDPYYSQNSNC